MLFRRTGFHILGVKGLRPPPRWLCMVLFANLYSRWYLEVMMPRGISLQPLTAVVCVSSCRWRQAKTSKGTPCVPAWKHKNDAFFAVYVGLIRSLRRSKYRFSSLFQIQIFVSVARRNKSKELPPYLFFFLFLSPFWLKMYWHCKEKSRIGHFRG